MRSLLVLFVLVLIVGAGIGAWTWKQIDTPVLLTKPQMVEIPPGATPKKVVGNLYKRGIVTNAQVVLLLARFRGLDTKFRHGRHKFAGALKADDVLRELVRAPQKPTVSITLLEGWTWTETAAFLDDRGIVSAADYKRAVCDPKFVIRAGASPGANCAEGFLFPDTYFLEPEMDAAAIADLQLDRFNEVFAELSAGHDPPKILRSAGGASTEDLRRSVTVLASIVEKETSSDAERARVAGVFVNRLQRGMRLQTDPTVIYAITSSGAPWNGNLTRADLRRPSPYNTYTTKGLPPGPICNPGRRALEAALTPDVDGNLFFVAKGDGSHEFTKNVKDHNRAVRRWQLHRRP